MMEKLFLNKLATMCCLSSTLIKRPISPVTTSLALRMNLSRNAIWIRDVDNATFERMLYYLYTGELEFNDVDMLKTEDGEDDQDDAKHAPAKRAPAR
jgi:hypothetical protein